MTIDVTGKYIRRNCFDIDAEDYRTTMTTVFLMSAIWKLSRGPARFCQSAEESTARIVRLERAHPVNTQGRHYLDHVSARLSSARRLWFRTRLHPVAEHRAGNHK